jgi:dihydroorotate dehydrogenase (fumarate)
MSPNLSTRYLGLHLANPVVPGASPLTGNLDQVRRLEDAGAAAVVMHSLFEEQIERDVGAEFAHMRRFEDVFSEAANFFPSDADYALGPEEYLGQLRRIKEAVAIPVIASLNGTRAGRWVDYASLIEKAGADALELNVFHLATDASVPGTQVRDIIIEVVREVKRAINVPVSVKLAPFFSSFSNVGSMLEAAGADGLVMFNRFYQPDIDVGTLEVVPRLELSSPDELRLRLRWLAILFGQIRIPMAATGGVHDAHDVVKALLAGATITQVVSCLLQKGPEHVTALVDGLRYWMEEHEYESVTQLRGALSLANCPDPAAFERANYLKTLQLWKT